MNETAEAVAGAVAGAVAEYEAPEPEEFNGEGDPTMGLGGAAVEQGGNFDPALLNGVEKLGDIIPSGTVVRFELRSWKKGTSDPWKPTKFNPEGRPEIAKYGSQPYYNVTLVAQQEPWTGKRIYEFIQFVNSATQAAAGAGDSVARDLCRKRLVRLNSFLAGIGYKPVAVFDIEKIFNSHPSANIRCGTAAKQNGSMGNTVAEYVTAGGTGGK